MKKLFSLEVLQYLGLLTQFGITMVAAILVGFFVGHYIDRWLRTGILMTIIFLIFGVVAGFLNVYRMIKRLEDTKKG